MFFVIPLAVIVGCKKDIISYKTTNGIFAFQKHIEGVHQQVWNESMNKRKMGVHNKGNEWPTKKQFLHHEF
jgi:hypothetical protein